MAYTFRYSTKSSKSRMRDNISDLRFELKDTKFLFSLLDDKLQMRSDATRSHLVHRKLLLDQLDKAQRSRFLVADCLLRATTRM